MLPAKCCQPNVASQMLPAKLARPKFWLKGRRSLRPTALSPVDLSFLVRGCRLNTLSVLNQLPCRRSLVEREHTRIRERLQLHCGFKALAGNIWLHLAGNIWLATFGWQHRSLTIVDTSGPSGAKRSGQRTEQTKRSEANEGAERSGADE